MTKLRRQFDGNDLLYRFLLAVVLLSYSFPIYIAITQSLPYTNHRTIWLLNLLAIVVLALTLKPVWNWVQPRLYHVVYDINIPQIEIIGQMSDSLTAASSDPSMLGTIAETIGRTVKLPYVQLETTGGAIAAFGAPVKGCVHTRIAINYREVAVGWLAIGSRLPNEQLTTSEHLLLNRLARLVGITLHAAQTGEMLQASREQLVTAREEERRRIRRDLHDDLGPTLASLRLQLSAVRRTVRDNPDEAERLIDELRDDVRAATGEIRRLVYDLWPPMLDEFGLIGALRHLDLASDSLTRTVEAPNVLPPLPAAVEVAIYRIAAEALHNIVRYANATHCTINLAMNEATLTLTVTDNGCGLPPTYLAGVGHRSMQERAMELGGTVSILSASTGGTCVRATFPLKERYDD